MSDRAMVRRVSRDARGWFAALILCSLTLSACGGGGSSVKSSAGGNGSTGSTGLQGTSTQAGSVALPTGVTTASTGALVAANSLGSVAVATNGSFTANTFSSSPQLETINTSGGQSILAGWLSTSEPVVNAQTTAEVYMFYATFVYTLPDATSQGEVIASIHTLPGLSAVTTAISAALVAHPTTSPSSDAGVQSAIASLVTALTTSTAMGLKARTGITAMAKTLGTSTPQDLAISPGVTASGITIVTAGNTIQFQNTYRREATAYVDDISHVDATSGKTINDNVADTNPPVPILAESGIGSFLGSISDYLNGNYALVPTTSAAVETPNVSGATSTMYRVAIVGPGASLGNYAQLTSTEQKQQEEQSVSTAINEVVLPLIATVVVPQAKFGALTNSTANALVQDVIATIASDAKIKAAAEAGDPEGVVSTAIADVVQSTALTEELCDVALELLEGTLVSQASNDAIAAVKVLAPYIRVTDAGIAVFDALGVIKDGKNSDAGDIFQITATDPTTTFLPSTSTIAPLATVTLTAAVHPPSEQPLVYQYATKGLFGTLTDASGNSAHVNNFTSSYATVTYTADATGGGTDTITVTPQVLVTGAPNESLATQTATVTVGSVPSPTPSPMASPNYTISLAPSGCVQFGTTSSSQTLTATINGPPLTAQNGFLPGYVLGYGWNVFPTDFFSYTVPAPQSLAPVGVIGLTSTITITSPNYPTNGGEDNGDAQYLVVYALAVNPAAINIGYQPLLTASGQGAFAAVAIAAGQDTCSSLPPYPALSTPALSAPNVGPLRTMHSGAPGHL